MFRYRRTHGRALKLLICIFLPRQTITCILIISVWNAINIDCLIFVQLQLPKALRKIKSSLMCHGRVAFLKAWSLSIARKKIWGSDYLRFYLGARMKTEKSQRRIPVRCVTLWRLRSSASVSASIQYLQCWEESLDDLLRRPECLWPAVVKVRIGCSQLFCWSGIGELPEILSHV